MVKGRVVLAARLALFALLLCVGARSAQAYWADNHMQINEQVAKEGKPFNFTRGGAQIRTVDDYIQRLFLLSGGGRRVRAVGFRRASWLSLTDDGDEPSDAPDTELSLFDWNKNGGLWEDGFLNMDEATEWGGYRAVNHFHDPIPMAGSGGYHGFIDTSVGKTIGYINLARSGISAYEWASDGANGHERSHWGLSTVTEGLWQYFIDGNPVNREKAIGNAFRAAGQVEHLIEDNTVPDHTRDLPHPGDGFEEYMQKHRQTMFGELRPQSAWNLLPLTTIEQKGFRSFWDGDVYNGANPRSVAPGAVAGISEVTNANFFAWNTFHKYIPFGQEIWFSRIPDEIHGPYRNPDDQVYYPYPLMDGKVDSTKSEPTYWSVTRDTYPMQPGAYGKTTHYPFQTPVWILDNTVWFNYAFPLMKLAHGYAQSFLTMALPPVDAEMIPDPSDPLHKVVVRLWNLGGDAQLGNGVTWHIKKVQLKPIQPERLPVDPPGLSNVSTPIDVPFSALDVPADGKSHDSDPMYLDYDQRYTLLNSSHIAVAIEAELGTTHPVTLKFGTIIPNSFVLLEQSSTNYVAAPALEPYSDECDNPCSPEWTRSAAGQWTHQQVQGQVELLATRLDALGKPALPELARVEQDLTHLAGLAVIAADTPAGITAWRFPEGVTLNVNGGKLERSPTSGVLWLRTENVDRNAVEDAPVSFTIDIHLDQASVDPQTTLMVANNLFLVAWSTSGSMSIQKLALWMPPVPKTGTQIYAENGSCPKGGLGHVVTSATWSWCTWSSDGPGCAGRSYLVTGRSIQTNAAWTGPFGIEASAVMFYGTQFPQLKPLELSGHAVPLETGNAPPTCSGSIESAGGGPCVTNGELLYMENRFSQGSVCPTAIPAPPPLPATAKLEVDYKFVQWRLEKLLKQPVPTTTLELH